MKKVIMITLAVCLSVALGTMAAATAAQIKQGGAMTVTYKDDISTLDPAIGYDWQNWSMIKALFNGLMDYEAGTYNLEPDLAESFTISPDGKIYTFKLRKDVKFHRPQAYGRRHEILHRKSRKSQDSKPGTRIFLDH